VEKGDSLSESKSLSPSLARGWRKAKPSGGGVDPSSQVPTPSGGGVDPSTAIYYSGGGVDPSTTFLGLCFNSPKRPPILVQLKPLVNHQ